MLRLAQFQSPKIRDEPIVWRRSHPKGHAFTRFATTHDVLLVFAKATRHTKWNAVYTPHDPERAAAQYSLTDDEGRAYQLTSLLNPNPDRPNLTYEFKGVTKVWRWTQERMAAEDAKGRIVVPRGGKGIPRYKRYLDEQEGIPLGDWWGDIEIALGGERLGYPTQKPEALLERVIAASSDEGDTVLDPFCGCGTAVAAAQKLNRRWIGIDITHLAINLIKVRLADAFGPKIAESYNVIGEPTTLQGATQLAAQDKYQFQYWALGLVGARPMEEKKGADKGIDGRLYITDSASETRSIIISVKGGNVTVSQLRDLRGVIERENAAVGVFITLEAPTAPMRKEAAEAGFFQTKALAATKHPRLQILTIEELLAGKRIDIPLTQDIRSFKKAPKAKSKKSPEMKLPFDAEAR